VTDWRERAYSDCYQDSCENCPFASVGGLEQRGNMQLPSWVPQADRDEYLSGYRDAALKMYGEDWQTREFGWRPAVTLPSPQQLLNGMLRERYEELRLEFERQRGTPGAVVDFEAWLAQRVLGEAPPAAESEPQP